MAEFEKPRRKRPGDSPDAGDDVYELEGDETSETSGDEPEAADSDAAGLLNEPDDRPHPLGRSNAATPASPPAPLPRIWKVAPDPDAVEQPPRKGKGKGTIPGDPTSKGAPPETSVRKPTGGGHRREGADIERIGQVKKPSERTSPSASNRREASKSSGRARNAPDTTAPAANKVLIEATPSLDTYEARQAARIVVGLVMLGIIGLTGLGVAWFFTNRSAPETPAEADASLASAPAAAPNAGADTLEQEARALFERAREAARKKDGDLAISMLERIVASYPSTKAAIEAKEALARPAQNLPLFADRPVVLANESAPAQAAPPAVAPEPRVVEATAPAAPAASAGEVRLVYPPNPAEPRRSPATPSGPSLAEDAPSVGRPLPAGFRSRPGTTVHASGWALEIVGERDGAPMVLVPGGDMLMGQDIGDPSEQPGHRVRLSTYYIDQHEVTVHQFDLFQKEVGRRTDRAHALARDQTPPPSSDDLPVVMVSAKDAKDYATWAGKRLPTEAQWEMAARGPDGRPYPWGPNPPEWKGKRAPRQIDPVMSFAEDVSPYGAYDMAGNAWEWTKDWYDPRYYVFVVKNQIVEDPTGPNNVPRSHQLTVRGGSKTWSITRRDPLKFDQRLPFLGFRCVLQVEGPDNAFQPPEKPAPAGTPATTGGASDSAPPPF